MKQLLVTALVAGAATLTGSAQAAKTPQAHPASPRLSASISLHQDMRKLWTDHVVWTRDYIVAAVADAPDQQAAAGRLMKNQEDIGAAVASFYGQAAGAKLTELLKSHISIAVDLIKAAKSGDAAGKETADKAWHRNADEIADFLSKANPNWP